MSEACQLWDSLLIENPRRLCCELMLVLGGVPTPLSSSRGRPMQARQLRQGVPGPRVSHLSPSHAVPEGLCLSPGRGWGPCPCLGKCVG